MIVMIVVPIRTKKTFVLSPTQHNLGESHFKFKFHFRGELLTLTQQSKFSTGRASSSFFALF